MLLVVDMPDLFRMASSNRSCVNSASHERSIFLCDDFSDDVRDPKDLSFPESLYDRLQLFMRNCPGVSIKPGTEVL